MLTCQLVSTTGIVVAKFKARNDKVPNIKTVQWRGRLFVRQHEHGGGEPSYYEQQPDISLQDWHCTEIVS